MLSIPRTSLEIGPAKYTFGGHSFYSKGASLVLEPERVQLATDRHGLLDERRVDLVGQLTVTPDGAWTAAARSALWPYANTTPGASLGLGSPNLVINCNDSADTRYTAKTAILSAMPQLLLSSRQSMIGQATFDLIREDNKAPNEADSFLVRDTEVYSDAALTVASLKTQAYTGAWGNVLTGIETEDGWTVDFALNLDRKGSNRYGTVDIRFASLQVTASCIPINQSVADIFENLRLNAWTAGQSEQNVGQALTLTGEDGTVAITIANSSLVRGSLRFGATEYRQAGISFVSTRQLLSGAPQALFTLA
jgi:hypothetical protein